MHTNTHTHQHARTALTNACRSQHDETITPGLQLIMLSHVTEWYSSSLYSDPVLEFSKNQYFNDGFYWSIPMWQLAFGCVFFESIDMLQFLSAAGGSLFCGITWADRCLDPVQQHLLLILTPSMNDTHDYSPRTRCGWIYENRQIRSFGFFNDEVWHHRTVTNEFLFYWCPAH